MIRASLEPGGSSDSTCGLKSSSSRRKCRLCVTIPTTSPEGSTVTESLGKKQRRGRQRKGWQKEEEGKRSLQGTCNNIDVYQDTAEHCVYANSGLLIET